MRYAARTAGMKPEPGWPVFINLHGGGNDPQSNDEGWAATMTQYPVRQGLCVSPRAPVNSTGSWNEPASIAALERLLVELPAKWEIDSNRVYLMGYSMGAIGVLHLGPSLPDRWAAVAASAGFNYLGARGRAVPDNLLNLPVMIQIGTADTDFQRYPLARSFAAAIRGLGQQARSGYRLEYKEHLGQGHAIDDRDTPGWLAAFSRDPLPTRVVWHQPLLPLPIGTADTTKLLERHYPFHAYLRRRCYWLRNDAPAAFQRLDVTRADPTAESLLFVLERPLARNAWEREHGPHISRENRGLARLAAGSWLAGMYCKKSSRAVCGALFPRAYLAGDWRGGGERPDLLTASWILL